MEQQRALFADHEEPTQAAQAERDALRKQVETPIAPHEPIEGDNHGFCDLRQPCPDCSITVGRIRLVGGQLTVRCANCDRFAFNKPRAELGLPTAPVTKEIKSQYAGACRVCCVRHGVGATVSWTKGVKGVLCLGCKAVGAGVGE